MKNNLCVMHSCDGTMHFTAVWDEDLNRAVPVDYICPKNENYKKVRT